MFGATAAAALYRRAMIEDVSIEGEFFDETFFAYREDADVAWRAQLLGWDCLYVPSALGYHVRRVLPSRRGRLPAMLNRHSVKNRFLMRIKNADGAVWRRCALVGLTRDAVVVGGCLAREWTSLPAFWDVATLWPRARRQRAIIQSRRRRDGAGDRTVVPVSEAARPLGGTQPLGDGSGAARSPVSASARARRTCTRSASPGSSRGSTSCAATPRPCSASSGRCWRRC